MSDLLLVLLPGSMFFWVLFIGQSPLQEILYDAHASILARVLSCPVTATQFVLAKMVRSFVLCAVSLVSLILLTWGLFGIRWGNPLVLAVVTFVCAASMTGLLALIYSIARTREQATVIAPLVLMTLAMVGGSMFPFENLPPFLQAVGQWTPNRWGVLLLQGAARSKPLAELVRPFLCLSVLGFAGSALALTQFKKRLERGGHA